jgi:hypothetical protein
MANPFLGLRYMEAINLPRCIDFKVDVRECSLVLATVSIGLATMLAVGPTPLGAPQ